jgi:SAM-dependent methyltransferase
MKIKVNNYTRGSGLLEPLLARLRANQANKLITPNLRDGRILDIGCGIISVLPFSYIFSGKFAIENQPTPYSFPDISWYKLNVNKDPYLPFNNGYFSVVTLLAVIEHLNPESLIFLFSEIYRTLHPGGRLILTTPAAWSDGLLRLMARFHLVSQEEINDHVFSYTLPLLGWYFGKANFSLEKLELDILKFYLIFGLLPIDKL